MSEVSGQESATTGEAPPPKPPAIAWRSALQFAVAVALVGAGLFAAASYFPAFTPLTLLWILSAAFLATRLYQRRHPMLRMDGSIGARIGLSVGVLTTALLAISLAAVGLIARFRLHSMEAFDAEMTQRMHEQIDRAIAANPAPADLVRQMLSQEFRTGTMLVGLLLFALLILLFSTFGGLLSGMIAVSRRDGTA